MTQYLSQAQGTGESSAPTGDVSQVQLSKWVEVSGGKKKKRVYGAGVLFSSYRKGISHLDINASSSSSSSSSSSAASTGRSYTIEEYAEMQRKVSDLQHQAYEVIRGQEVLKEQHEVLKEQHENLEAKVQQMEEQQRQMLELLQQQGVRPTAPQFTYPQELYYGPPPPHVHLYLQPTPPHSHPQPLYYGGYWPTTPLSQYQQSMQPPPQQHYYRPQPVQPQPHIHSQEPHPGQGTTYAKGMADDFNDRFYQPAS